MRAPSSLITWLRISASIGIVHVPAPHWKLQIHVSFPDFPIPLGQVRWSDYNGYRYSLVGTLFICSFFSSRHTTGDINNSSDDDNGCIDTINSSNLGLSCFSAWSRRST